MLLDPCTESKRRECASGSGEMIGILCQECPKHDRAPGDYMIGLYRNHLLIAAGYPIAREDLSLEAWLDLGRLRDRISSRRGVF